jgi:MFS family permease
MGDLNRSRALERNVRLYPWYQLALGFWPWIPVFFLYFGQHLSLERVLLLESIYYAAVVCLELPSGYFSDRMGRRATLLIASACFVLSYALFFLGSSFAVFAAGQLLLAAGFAFNSGSDTALHFDSLAALDRDAEYGPREARASRTSFLAGAAGAVAGGAAASFALRWAYGLSFLSALLVLGIVLAMREPRPVASGARPPALRFDAQLLACLRQLRRPDLAWLFAFAVAMTVLIHIPYELYQPYLDLWAAQGGGSQSPLAPSRLPVPLASGLLMAASMLIGSWVAGRSVELAGRVGTTPTLLSGLTFLVLLIGVMSRFLAGWVLGLLLLRNVSRALMAAPLNAAVTPRLPENQRATYLSLQSLSGRLGFSLTLVALSRLAGADSEPGWAELSRLLGLSTFLGIALLVALSLAARPAGVDAASSVRRR